MDKLFGVEVSGLHFTLLREGALLNIFAFQMNPIPYYPKPVRTDYNLPLQKIIRPKGVHNGHIRTQVTEITQMNSNCGRLQMATLEDALAEWEMVPIKTIITISP